MRPKLYNTPEEMQKVIDEYFNLCDTNIVQVYDKKSESVVDLKKPIPYCIEGLCDVLDMTRQSLMNYQKNSEFFTTIKKAKNMILRNQVESGLMGITDKTMTIFLLKNNHSYSDKQEIKHSGQMVHRTVIVNPTKEKE